MARRLLAILVFGLTIFSTGICRAQWGYGPTFPQPNGAQQMLGGGLGLTYIDGKAYYLIDVTPELHFGKLGLGVDLDLRYDAATGALRKQDYRKFSDYLRVIRFVSWAQKGDPLYVKAGELDYAQLGHGFIMYNYTNSASYELRKWGGELAMNFEKGGFESIYSDIASRDHGGVFGLRGYVRPLKFTSAGDVPLLGKIEVGATAARDFNTDADVTPGPGGAPVTHGDLSVYGADVGLPILSHQSLRSTLYFDAAKIKDFGHGSAAGIDLQADGLGLVNLGAKYERRFLGDQFIPEYFDALYEHDRFVPADGSTPFHSKVMDLESATASQGYYGELRISLLNTINVLGGYSAPLGVPDQGVFHAIVETPPVMPKIVVRGGYDRDHIGKFFVLDENSLLYTEVGYKPMPFLIVSTVYQWTFTRDASGHLVTQKRIEPRVSFVTNL